jgi:hypothetical protein
MRCRGAGSGFGRRYLPERSQTARKTNREVPTAEVGPDDLELGEALRHVAREVQPRR